MGYRTEHDTMGEILVPDDRMWGAQTQRSYQNFAIGTELIPCEIIHAFALLKWAAAKANFTCGKLDEARYAAITAACEEILEGKHAQEFPLKVWQTGSGTQSNMNVNEVVAYIGNRAASSLRLHPNDHVNMSQSSNDTFPTAMNIAAVLAISRNLIPAMEALAKTLARLEDENREVIKIGRTHLMDAVPIRFSQEISGWRAMLEENLSMLRTAVNHLRQLALGGTAVGTGLNCPAGFDVAVAEYISEKTGEKFVTAPNKYHALTSKDAFVFVHGALKSLAANLMKIANDIRWLASGPRCGLGEIFIPENEPGSSIMPGKVNPTQCEAITMIAVQVMGNDTAIGVAASQGNFELNVFMPVIAYNMLQSVRLLADGITSFERNCVCGIRPNTQRMAYYLEHSLMLVTCLTPKIGYENAAAAAKMALKDDISLKQAVVAMGFLTDEEYDEVVRPENMV